MAKDAASRLASLDKSEKQMQDKLKLIKQKKKMLQVEVDLEKYKALAPIAQGAIDVFGNQLPQDRKGAAKYFQDLLDMVNQGHNNNNYQKH